jgi:hypothetical protein
MITKASPSRVMVYVDGFNFYYATRWTEAYPSGWCNWRDTAQNYCDRGQIVTGVRYFTSTILSKNSAKVWRQELHIRAMETIATVVQGKFAGDHNNSRPTVVCCAPTGKGSRTTLRDCSLPAAFKAFRRI